MYGTINMYLGKTEALLTVTVQLLCVSIFTDAQSSVSHDAAHFKM